MNKPKAAPTLPLPHSWDLTNWPPHVYPHTERKGRYIVRAHRNELVRCGALTRVGRDLVVLGNGWEVWLRAQSARVIDYQPIPPNVRRRTQP